MRRAHGVSRRRRPRSAHGAAGFTLIEVLIAMALLGLIMVGVLPLFTQSMMNNLRGNRGTQSTNSAMQVLEDAGHDRFQSPDLSWATADLQLTIPTQYLVEDPAPTVETVPQWVAAVPAGQTEAWRRDVVVRTYRVNDLDDGLLDDPLAGTIPTSSTQLKLIEVQVRAGGAFAPAFVVRRLKAW